MGLSNLTAISSRKDLGVSNMEVYEGDDIIGFDASVDAMVSLIANKTQGRRTMRRSEFDPLDFAQQLPNLDIYDFEASSSSANETAYSHDAIISFSGSESSAYYGECTGMHLKDIEPEVVSQRAIAFCKIINELKGQIVAVVTPGSDRSHLSRIILFVTPLTDETDTINGACVYNVMIGRDRAAA